MYSIHACRNFRIKRPDIRALSGSLQDVHIVNRRYPALSMKFLTFSVMFGILLFPQTDCFVNRQYQGEAVNALINHVEYILIYLLILCNII